MNMLETYFKEKIFKQNIFTLTTAMPVLWTQNGDILETFFIASAQELQIEPIKELTDEKVRHSCF